MSAAGENGHEASQEGDGSQNPYSVVIAIDFGTAYSGYAFSWRSNKEMVRMPRTWGQCLGISEAFKTPTCLLLDKKLKFVAFGYEALHHMSKLKPREQQNYRLFEKFKMHLHRQKLTRTTFLNDHRGALAHALDIFALSLKYLKDRALKEIKSDTTYSVPESLVRWVVTVPVIWSPASKQFMREAACKAGIVNDVTSRRLKIALEPEAASIYCQMSPPTLISGQNQVSSKMTKGMQYLVLDCGGGTFDITAHEIQDDQSLVELYNCHGGANCGVRVDENFTDLLDTALGGGIMNDFRASCPRDYLQMLSQFEIQKSGVDPHKGGPVSVPVPLALNEKCEELRQMSFASLLKSECKIGGISYIGGHVEVSFDIIRRDLFGPVITKIVDHAAEILKIAQLEKVSHILLIGGFGQSRILQEAMKTRFGERYKILVHPEASRCVAKGAVVFGHDPDVISERVSRKTYGLEMADDFDPSKHDEARSFMAGGKKLVRKLFSRFVKKGESVAINQRRSKKVFLVEQNQKNVSYNFYQTDKDGPKYVDEEGVELIGTFTFQPPDKAALDYSMELRITFGGTEIQAEVKGQDGRSLHFNMEFLAGTDGE